MHNAVLRLRFEMMDLREWCITQVHHPAWLLSVCPCRRIRTSEAMQHFLRVVVKQETGPPPPKRQRQPRYSEPAGPSGQQAQQQQGQDGEGGGGGGSEPRAAFRQRTWENSGDGWWRHRLSAITCLPQRRNNQTRLGLHGERAAGGSWQEEVLA